VLDIEPASELEASLLTDSAVSNQPQEDQRLGLAVQLDASLLDELELVVFEILGLKHETLQDLVVKTFSWPKGARTIISSYH
jgi:hypothetical protein